VALLLLAVNDAGQLMNAVADGNDTDTALAKVAVIPEDRRRAMLGLLSDTYERLMVAILWMFP